MRPVGDELVNAVRPHVPRQVWAMVELQRLTGARSGEVVIMRPCDIEMTGSLRLYRPECHKTEHFGHQRIVEIGPRARRIVGEFLPGRTTDAYLFSPLEADLERRANLRQRRISKVPPSQLNRRKRAPARKPKKNTTRPATAVPWPGLVRKGFHHPPISMATGYSNGSGTITGTRTNFAIPLQLVFENITTLRLHASSVDIVAWPWRRPTPKSTENACRESCPTLGETHVIQFPGKSMQRGVQASIDCTVFASACLIQPRHAIRCDQ